MSIKHDKMNPTRTELYRKLEEAENEITNGANSHSPASVKKRLKSIIASSRSRTT